LGHDRGGDIAWLYQHGEVLERHDDEEGASLTVRLSPDDRKRFEQGRAAMQN
jgi:GTP-binding protein HflX